MSELPLSTAVLIAGSGPCGLMLALELGRRGVAALVIDPKPSTAVNPQANATQARTMEHFRRHGFADEIRALGLPPDYPTDIAYFTRYADLELARFRLPAAKEAAAIARGATGSWSAAELPHRVSQKFVEKVMRRHALEHDSVSIHNGWRLTHFEDGADGLIGFVENAASGEQRTVLAQYLAGVDGARSAVRRQLNINYSGETGVSRHFFGGRMVAVYLRAPDFYRVMPHDRAWMYWAFNTERRSWLAAVNGKDEFAFHTQLKPGEEDQPINEALARKLFGQVMGRELAIEVLAVDTWIAGHALVADSLQEGRVLIGGDAAHLFTPAGGLGYNTAVEDAVNLGWKLAAVIKGNAGPKLLATYASERRALAIRNTGWARKLAKSIGDFAPRPEIEEAGPAGDAARAEASEYLNGHARREFNIPGITFGGRYDDSPVIVADGAVLAEDAANVYVPTASPGGRAPHLWLEDGRSIYDVFNVEWTLLCTNDTAPDRDAVAAAATRYGMDLKLLMLPDPKARALYEADLVLIRPDQIVAWRGSEATLDMDAVFGQVMGY